MFCQKPWRFWGTVLGMALSLLISVARLGKAVEYQEQFIENFDDPLLDLPAQWELVQGDWQDWDLSGGSLHAQLQRSPDYPQAAYSVISMITLKDEYWPDYENYKVSFSFIPHDTVDKNFAILFRSQLGFNDQIILDMIDFHFFDGILYLDYLEVGRGIYADGVRFSLELDKEYQVAITSLNGKFSLYIDDELIYETNDNWPEFKLGAGKFAFRASRGDYATSFSSFDNLKIEPYFDFSLPLLMQTDIKWRNELYDTANLWAGEKTKIADWGCALTSAVMILHYYGYDKLGDKELNPSTLNQWLLAEPDGYVGDGLVNWLAICRLVAALAKDCDNCPKLEYQYFVGDGENDLEEKIKSQLELKQPVIGHITEHFLVIDGLSSEDDFTIKDPYFPAELLSEAESELLSLRLLQPSFTDLSYWFFELPVGTEINIEGFNLQSLDPSWPGDQQFYYFAKPSSGTYYLDLSFLGKEDLSKADMYFYSNSGGLQAFNLGEFLTNEIFFNVDNFSLQLDYFKDGSSQLSLVKDKPMMTFYLEYQLESFLNWQANEALKGNLLGVERYQNLIEKFLSFYDLTGQL